MGNNVKDIINFFSTNMYVIDQKMENKQTYKKFINEILDYLKAGFEIKELRECPVHFKFHENGYIYTVQLRHFLTNLIFWEPLIVLDAVDSINESFLIDPTKLSSGYIKSYIDNKIVIPYRKKVSNRKLNKIIHDLIYNLSRISTDFSILFGLTMNIETFIDVANKNERFNEIIRTKLDPAMQPSEIESKLHDLMNEEINILMTEDNALRPMLRSGTGIKAKQLSEFSISGGLKPDISGSTIPIPINSNLVVGGLSSISGYFIDSIGGRKALIFNKNVMGRSGHFARKTMLLVSDIKLRNDYDHCGSVHPVVFEVKTKEHLKRLIGRNYRLFNEREYHVLTKDDNHLIGQRILVKSPLTCASHEGICEDCYGETLFHTNWGGVGVGAYAGAIITNPVSQSVLSSKHLLTTTSETIDFNEHFNKFFNLVANEITLNSDNDINHDDYSLLIIKKNIVTLNELDEGEINEFLTMFHVKNNQTGEIYEIHEKELKELYIAPELKDMMKGKLNAEYYEIPFMDIPDDSRLFLLQIENAELTRPLYGIMGLLDTKERRRELGVETIHDLAQVMLDLLIESKINVMSVHAEVLLSPLVRSMDDILKKPNFKKYDAMDDVQLLTVSSALEKHPSVLIGLSFQFLGRQLLNPLTFRKTGESFLDPFFKELP